MIRISAIVMRFGVLLTVVLILLGWTLGSKGLVFSGLATLVSLPFVRVFLVFLDFTLKKEKILGAMSLAILFMLILSLFLGHSI